MLSLCFWLYIVLTLHLNSVAESDMDTDLEQDQEQDQDQDRYMNPIFKCRLCKDKMIQFTSRRELFIHQTNCHYLDQIGGACKHSIKVNRPQLKRVITEISCYWFSFNFRFERQIPI